MPTRFIILNHSATLCCNNFQFQTRAKTFVHQFVSNNSFSRFSLLPFVVHIHLHQQSIFNVTVVTNLVYDVARGRASVKTHFDVPLYLIHIEFS